jgi:predicted  nucleic acid-binding Zn-ribbon protein
MDINTINKDIEIVIVIVIIKKSCYIINLHNIINQDVYIFIKKTEFVFEIEKKTTTTTLKLNFQ